MKKILLVICLCGGLLGGLSLFGLYFRYKKYHKEKAPPAVEIVALETAPLPETIEEPAIAPVLNLEVPFFAQAPKADWSYPYQEACEEASCLLAANVYNNLQLNTESFDRELLKLIAWEQERFGYYYHTTAAETAVILEEYFGLTATIHKNPELIDIALILNRGSLVIAPVAGKLIENPYYTNGGPVYHMMVIKGYDLEQKKIITNDVGTRQGADLLYRWHIFQNGLHDWHDSDIEQGEKLIIEVRP